MKAQLEKLGLSDHEAEVYLALLPLGTSLVGPLIKKTGLHRYVVYETLRKLQDRSLVTQTTKSGRKYFTAADPALLEQEAARSARLAQELVPKLKEMASQAPQKITLYEGTKGFADAYFRIVEELPKGSTFCVTGALYQEWEDAMGEYGPKYRKAAAKKDIGAKLLAWQQDAKALAATPNYDQRLEVRALPESFLSPSNISLWGDHTYICIFGSPPLIIDIENKAVTQGFLKQFETLWKRAKKVKDEQAGKAKK